MENNNGLICQNSRCRKPIPIDETLFDIDLDWLQKIDLKGKIACWIQIIPISLENNILFC